MSNTATSIAVGVYKGGWNCPNKLHWSLIVTSHGYWREVTSDDGPLKNTTLLGIVHTSVSTHCPKTIVDYIQRLAISPSVASTDLEEDDLVLHLRNVEHQHPGGTQVRVQHGFANVSYRAGSMSTRTTRNVREMR